MNISRAVRKSARIVGRIRCLEKSLSAFWEKPGIRNIMVRLTKKNVNITDTPDK
jgi:hypothetical protein